MKDLKDFSLKVITGCMFANKTDKLLETIDTKPAFLFKPDVDKRYGANVVRTHNGLREHAAITIPVTSPETILEVVRTQNLYLLFNFDHQIKLIAIDEVQFFASSILKVIQYLIKNDYQIITAGLDTDFRGEPFHPMPEIMALADEIIKLKACCGICQMPATRTQRLINGQPAPYHSPLIVIGGKEQYEPRCLKHHQVPEKLY